MAKKNKDFDE
jgi:hypothetical protein